MKTILALVTFSCLLCVACNQTTSVAPSPSPSIETESSDPIQIAVAEVGAGQALLIDVREQSEWDQKSLSKANLVSMSKMNDDVASIEGVDGISKTIKLYVHCAKGMRAKKMADVLVENGYNAVPLEVSFEELVEKGFELSDENSDTPK